MESTHQDQDRSTSSTRETTATTSSSSRFISTGNLRFDEPQRSLPSRDRIPVVILHPNSIVRLGIHHAWSTSHFVVVSGIAASWKQLPGDLTITDTRAGVFGLPQSEPNELEVHLRELATIVREFPHIRWVVVANSLPNGIHQAIAETGAFGLIEGEFTSERLESVIMWIDAGRRIGLDDSMPPIESTPASTLEKKESLPTLPSAKPTVHSFAGAIESSNHLDSRTAVALNGLSAREEQVLEGLAEGKTNQQIANGLFLSVKTIETYRSRLKQKLGVTDRASMVAILNGQRKVG